MTIKGLIAVLEQTVAAGNAREDDLIIMVEYDRIHLRPRRVDPLPKSPVVDGVTVTREDRPIHDARRETT